MLSCCFLFSCPYNPLLFQADLKLNIEKTKIMVSSPITSWQVDGENGQWLTLLFWAPKSQQKVTAAMKLRHLLLGRKVTTKLDSIIKRRDITLSTKVLLISSVQFSSVQSVSDSLQPHESQHARPPRPSPTPRVHSNSHPSSR